MQASGFECAPGGELQIVVSPQRPLLFEEYAERVHATFEIGFVKELIYIKLGIAEMVQDISCHGRLLDDELQLAECHVQSGDVLRVSLKAARVDASVVSDPASKKRRINTPALSQIKQRRRTGKQACPTPAGRARGGWAHPASGIRNLS